MINVRAIAWAIAVALGACSGPSADLPGDAPGDASVPGGVVTDRGVVIGHRAGAITSFLGVPYAAPPIGALRWRAPQPHAAWTEPLDAASLGPACAQSEGGLGQMGPYSEDCLTLNVWTADPAARAPVMVFLHGGAFVHGSSNQPTYDGAGLAARGVVVVTINYRLGVLGFLAHPALTAEDEHGSSGNTGLLDQQAALRWVKANIAALGGDPDNVTVFGESAGSMSVCTHVASPTAAGLFHRAIGESGACMSMTTPRAAAESRGLAVAHALGCDTTADVLGCMRARPVAELIAAAPGSEDGEGGLELQPNIDGHVLVEPPALAYAAGRINPLDGFLGGTNLDEANLFTRAKLIDSEAAYEAAVTTLVPAHAQDALALYPAADYPSYKDAYNALVTDAVFACPTRAQARHLARHGTTAYLYLFTQLSTFGSATGLGVYHGSELPFVFGTLTARSGMSAADRALSDAMMSAWTRFAATGDPGGTPAWPSRGTGEAYLELGEPIRVAAGFHAATCDAMEQWRATP